MATKRAKRGASREPVAVEAAPRVNLAAWFNRLLILAGAGVVIAAGYQGWNYISSQPIEHVRFTGELEKLQHDGVQAVVAPSLAGGFLNADLARIRRDLEALPWIYEVSVRRRWPSSLEIHVVQQRPIARWGESGFLNHSGEVFQSRRAEDGGELPALRGPDGSARELMAQYLRLLPLLRPLGLELQELEVDQRGELRATLADDMELVIGNTQVIERVRRFAAIYSQHLQDRRSTIERIDLRYDNGLAVAFREPVQDQAASQVAGL